MKSEITKELKSMIGEKWVIDSKEKIENYLKDETALPSMPVPNIDEVLVKPANTKEISQIIKLANMQSIPITPRGGGTGLCAAAVPTKPGIILSLERLDEIIEIDEDNMMVTCEAGVTLGKLIERLEEIKSLYFPLHPGDEGAHIGGLVAENAGGSRAVQHGVMRNHIKGLEVVLPTGEIIKISGKVLKNNTGYDLMQLFIGSEGTLGVITKVILRLYHRPKVTATLLISYKDRHDAINTVPKILQHGVVPLSIEYVERELVENSAHHLGTEWPDKEGSAYLYVIITGSNEEELYSQSEEIEKISKSYNAINILFADSKREQDKILGIRSNIYTALKKDSADILDVTVPPNNIGKLMDEIDSIAEKFKTHIPIYGHAGDGNLHPHIMKQNSEVPPYLDEIREEIYRKALDLGGIITGEHGIGKSRIKNLSLALDKKQIELMKKIKKTFDPNNILNPETVVELDK